MTAVNTAGHAPATSKQVGPVTPSAAQVQSALHSVSAKHAIGKKPAFTLTFDAPSAGRLQVAFYYLPKGAHLATAHAKAVLVASAKAVAHDPGPLTVKLALTAQGRAMLKRSVKVSAKATFTPSGGRSTTTVIAVKL